MRISIFISVVCAQVAFGAWTQDRFVIGSYWDPPYFDDEAADIKSLQQFKDAGFNTLAGLVMHIDPAQSMGQGGRLATRWRRAVQLGGISLFTADGIQGPSPVASVWTSNYSLQSLSASPWNCPSCRDNMLGYHVWDEPTNSETLPINRAKAIYAKDTNKVAWVNLFGSSVDVSLVPDYGAYVQKYLKAGLRVLSFDHYPLYKQANSSNILMRGTYYKNHQIFADSTSKYGIPFWAFPMSTPDSNVVANVLYTAITKSSIQLTAYVPVIYGAKGLFWFTYDAICKNSVDYSCPVGGSGDIYGNRAVVMFDGSPNTSPTRPIYSWVQSTNKYLGRIGADIMRWKWQSTVHGSITNNQPSDGWNQPTNSGFESGLPTITSSTPILKGDLGSSGKFFAVGIFSGRAEGESFLAVLNKDLDTARTVNLSLKAPARAYLTTASMDSWDGKGQVSALSLTLQPGEMQVVRLTTQSVSGNIIPLQ